MTLHPRTLTCGYLSVYALTNGNSTLELLHKTQAPIHIRKAAHMQHLPHMAGGGPLS